MFIASSYWRGSMNVKQMRQFRSEQDAIGYVANLPDCNLKGKFVSSFARVYEVFPDKPPRLIKL